MDNKKIKSVFFGTPEISVHFLEKLKKNDFLFDLIITNPDRPTGRKKILTPSAVKIWAKENNIEILSPENLNGEILGKLKNYNLFFVLAYGKILKKELLDLPEMGVWNLHPSLLPKYRGPSPIMSAILDDQKKTGISLMLLDEKMDHGPILSQQRVTVQEWKKNFEMEKEFSEIGAEMFLKTLKKFQGDEIFPKEQNHDEATFCKKYEKSDMELEFPFSKDNARKNFLKYIAFPKPFFVKENKRYILTSGIWNPDKKEFEIKKVIPEGKKEREWKN